MVEELSVIVRKIKMTLLLQLRNQSLSRRATCHAPTAKTRTPRFERFGEIQQWIESVLDALKGQRGLERHGGRALAGVHSRVAAKLLVLATGIRNHWLTGAPRKLSLTAYDNWELIL